MTAKSQFWVVDPATGDHSLVGAAERDELVGRDWTVVEQPDDDAIVTIWREGIAEPGRYPASAVRDLWEPRGWVAGPPPGGTHPAAPKAAVSPSAPKSSKSGAAGEVKEKPGA